MAFQLHANETVKDGILRNVRHQIEKALKYLSAEHKAHRHDAAENEAVHEIRKCFKKVRAALRLVREDLGDDVYHEENWCFRDAARPLTKVRDAEVLVEIADKLKKQFAAAVDPQAGARIHDALLENKHRVARSILDDGKVSGAVQDIALRALARIPGWKIERKGWVALEGGLRHVYRTGHRALASASESPSVENLHEWRKQAMYLWHQLQLLDGAWVVGAKQLVEQSQQLSALLGEDHDLAVLRETLAADPLGFGGHRVLKGVFTVIDHRREELERQAFALGRELYKDSPKFFTSRIVRLMPRPA